MHGLTTAATLWFATALGLCFGGGQLVLGSAVLLIGLFTLDGLKSVEKRRKQDRHAMLTITVEENGPTEDEIVENLKEGGFEIGPWSFSCTKPASQRDLRTEVRWRAYPQDVRPPKFLQTILAEPGVIKVEWNP